MIAPVAVESGWQGGNRTDKTAGCGNVARVTAGDTEDATGLRSILDLVAKSKNSLLGSRYLGGGS